MIKTMYVTEVPLDIQSTEYDIACKYIQSVIVHILYILKWIVCYSKQYHVYVDSIIPSYIIDWFKKQGIIFTNDICGYYFNYDNISQEMKNICQQITYCIIKKFIKSGEKCDVHTQNFPFITDEIIELIKSKCCIISDMSYYLLINDNMFDIYVKTIPPHVIQLDDSLIFDEITPIILANLNRYILPKTYNKFENKLSMILNNIDCEYIHTWLINRPTYSKVKKAIVH